MRRPSSPAPRTMAMAPAAQAVRTRVTPAFSRGDPQAICTIRPKAYSMSRPSTLWTLLSSAIPSLYTRTQAYTLHSTLLLVEPLPHSSAASPLPPPLRMRPCRRYPPQRHPGVRSGAARRKVRRCEPVATVAVIACDCWPVLCPGHRKQYSIFRNGSSRSVHQRQFPS